MKKSLKKKKKAKEKEEDDKEKISFFNPGTEIKLSDARKLDKTVNVGDTIDTEVTPKDFVELLQAPLNK